MSASADFGSVLISPDLGSAGAPDYRERGIGNRWEREVVNSPAIPNPNSESRMRVGSSIVFVTITLRYGS